jgi:tRNA(fMet)-specific endonuclease VapC
LSFLLDTNVCIAAINGRPAAVAERVAHELARRNTVVVSTVTLFELRYGIAKSQQAVRNTRTLDAFLVPMQIMPFDRDEAQMAGTIRAELERLGTPIGPYDYLIAAQAIRNNLTLITANVKEFARVSDLRWENWAS